MEALKIITIIQTIAFIQGYDSIISTEPPKFRVNVKSVPQKDQRFGPCSWTLSTSSVIAEEDIYSLSSQICLSLGCGDVYKLRARDAEFNSTCLTGCLYHNSELSNCSQTVGNHCKMLSEVICGFPYVAPTSSQCSWTIKSPDLKSSVSLSEDTVHSVSREICHALGCGQVYNVSQSSAGLSTTCFTNCFYHDYQLKNCSEVINSSCSVLSEVKCGNAPVRLVGGGHRCGGRVEVWRESWGTVCDDGWGLEDAHVVCAQLGCGYALSVSGHGEPYGKGTGPIHMDELNCTGKERTLWDCPAIMNGHDCGHKEDAGVVCSEYKALRLTGGLDRCSGRVEVHRNGSWGTVCDTSWHKEEAKMACDMLNCGTAKNFTAFDPPFNHSNGSLWYFYCWPDTADLWQCQEYINLLHLCTDAKAAGLICNNSLGLPVPTSPQPSSAPSTTGNTTMDKPPGFLLTSEQLGCFVLGFLLLIAVITNILWCHHNKKRKAAVAQKRYMNLQTPAEAEENNYRDSVHLVKVTNNSTDAEVPVSPLRIWAQSSIESESCDTDYEQHDISPETAFPLSTFQNSMRYSADGKRPAVKGTNLNSVMEEAVPAEVTVGGYQRICDASSGHNAQQLRESAISVDSFESSCTSSGECYENTGTHAQDLCSQESAECYENTGENRDNLQSADNADFLEQESGRSVLGHTTDPPFSYQELDKGGGNREDSPVYSPVSYDNEAISSESDYDDIGNYLQQPAH
ncbi:T-cell differentiation antigen CD6 [Labeo rohita]|uniref:T-cell differentiation antigen CD6 n=1 Tax=Labeo rohita TaxID=84645 RepID=A0ABQ8LP92_LABRO|nr:T-cell differentiation antigen CD6 [Labeo rohita]XP_050993286.1 T-cell differentiation antigen CD6 [Labeo rohita]KAI2652473.1 T-cell differentiation antigen CD6 [Labeo rohita]